MADDKNNKHDHWPFWAGIGLFVVIIGFYSLKIDGSLSTDTTDWGTFGDYVGGLANPVIALIVLWYIWRSFEANKKAVEELKKQTEIQRIESKINILVSRMNLNLVFLEKSQETITEFSQKEDEIEERKQIYMKEKGEDESTDKLKNIQNEIAKYQIGFKEKFDETARNIDICEERIVDLEKELKEI